MFTGYSDKTVDFFWDIRFNNSRMVPSQKGSI